ncbi:MAG: hypothetical protein HGA39_06940 [Coriobacteriia bacterium]|nr:hypothetical protein [Coriobacteriia bacterium]
MTPELNRIALVGGAGLLLVVAMMVLIVSAVRGSRARKRQKAAAAQYVAPPESGQSPAPAEPPVSPPVWVQAEEPLAPEPVGTAVLQEIEPADFSPEEVPVKYAMTAPAEMWFDDLHVGVKAESVTAERLRYYADILLDEVHNSSSKREQ